MRPSSTDKRYLAKLNEAVMFYLEAENLNELINYKGVCCVVCIRTIRGLLGFACLLK